MIKGAPVKTEARAIPGASATTEVQNNILLAASDPADASVVLLCRSSCMILLPLELWSQHALFAMPNSTIGLILQSGNGEAEITFRFLPTKAAMAARFARAGGLRMASERTMACTVANGQV